MSQETYTSTNLYFNYETQPTVSELKAEIEELKKRLEAIESLPIINLLKEGMEGKK